MGAFRDLTNQRFGRWTALFRLPNRRGKTMWHCQCVCGVERAVTQQNLCNGTTKSCGCLEIELSRKRFTVHGMNKTRLHRIWVAMRTRCNNPKASGYADYGGRGINVCQDWSDSFQSFYCWAMLNGYEDSLSIDRINVNAEYSPENCRWANGIVQARNRRSNHVLTTDIGRKTLIEVAIEKGINRSTLSWRIKNGIPLLIALSNKRMKRRPTRDPPDTS